MEQLGLRILKLFDFCFRNGFECGVVWYENAFHVTVSKDGNIYSYGEEPTLTAALNSCAEGLKKGGF